MRTYLLVMVIAAAVTFLSTPLARSLAQRLHAVTPVRARDVHSVPTARLGGIAMLAGLVVAGLPTDRFFFEGFLPEKSAARRPGS